MRVKCGTFSLTTAPDRDIEGLPGHDLLVGARLVERPAQRRHGGQLHVVRRERAAVGARPLATAVVSSHSSGSSTLRPMRPARYPACTASIWCARSRSARKRLGVALLHPEPVDHDHGATLVAVLENGPTVDA